MRIYSIYTNDKVFVCALAAKSPADARKKAREMFPNWRIGFRAHF